MSNQRNNQKIDLRPAMKKMISAGMSKTAVTRELSFANQIVFSDAYLQKCSKNSLLAAVVNVANMGLTLNPAAQQAYLIARYDRHENGYKAQLMPGYRGFLHLLVKSGGVKSVVARLVYEQDEFEINYTDELKPVKHKPYLRKDKGEIIGGYALAVLPDNSRIAEWMPIEDINAIRDSSDSYKKAVEKGYKNSPWLSHYSEMCRKTLIRRIQKYLPTTNGDKVYQALQIDNQDYSASWNQLEYIDNLLPTANIRPEEAEQIQRNVKEYGHYTQDEAARVIEYLTENQVDNGVYSSKQLDAKIRERVENAD